jgi:hypothetical protein
MVASAQTMAEATLKMRKMNQKVFTQSILTAANVHPSNLPFQTPLSSSSH